MGRWLPTVYNHAHVVIGHTLSHFNITAKIRAGGKAFGGPSRLLWILVMFLACSGPPEGPDHLVLVVFDTLRADRMSVNGYELDTTPFLVNSSHEFLRFADVITPAPWTVPAHASLFTGLQPAEHRAQWGRMFLDLEKETLAEILQRQGFCTVGLSANPIVDQSTGLDQGFEEFEVVEEPWPIRSVAILDRMADILEGARRRNCRLFLFLNLMDAHIPYSTGSYSESYGVEGAGPVHSSKIKWRINAGQRKFSAANKRLHGAAYDAAVRHIDDLAQVILLRLRKHGFLDETLVLLTSDHGEGLGAHAEVGHSISVWQEQLKVPLLVRFPDGRHGGEVVAERTSLSATTPTVLDWLGVERPSTMTEADDLWQAARAPVTADYRSYFGEGNRTANREVAEHYPELAQNIHHAHVLYCQPFKLIVDASGRRRFYNLAVDPEEQGDLADVDPENLDRCWANYRRLLGQGRFTPFSYEPPDPADTSEPEVDIEALEALGYIQ